MKKLIILGFILLTQFGFAKPKVLTQLEFGVTQTQEPQSGFIGDSYNVELFNNKELVVKVTPVCPECKFIQDPTQTFRFQLSKRNYEEISELMTSLQYAEIESKENLIVCMMIMQPYMRISPKLSLRIDKKIQTVYDRPGCWAGYSVMPKEEHYKNLSFELIGSLKSLAIELTSQQSQTAN